MVLLYQYLFKSVSSDYDSEKRLVAFYIFFILVLVLAFILGGSSLNNDHPGYNIYDCKRSTTACGLLFHYEIGSGFGQRLVIKGDKSHA